MLNSPPTLYYTYMKIESDNRALVLGGGIAGLLAARVLCKHFDCVTVIERDSYPKDGGPRNGTPQSNHVHVLLMRESKFLRNYFQVSKRIYSKTALIG